MLSCIDSAGPRSFCRHYTRRTRRELAVRILSVDAGANWHCFAITMDASRCSSRLRQFALGNAARRTVAGVPASTAPRKHRVASVSSDASIAMIKSMIQPWSHVLLGCFALRIVRIEISFISGFHVRTLSRDARVPAEAQGCSNEQASRLRLFAEALGQGNVRHKARTTGIASGRARGQWATLGAMRSRVGSVIEIGCVMRKAHNGDAQHCSIAALTQPSSAAVQVPTAQPVAKRQPARGS